MTNPVTSARYLGFKTSFFVQKENYGPDDCWRTEKHEIHAFVDDHDEAEVVGEVHVRILTANMVDDNLFDIFDSVDQSVHDVYASNDILIEHTLENHGVVVIIDSIEIKAEYRGQKLASEYLSELENYLTGLELDHENMVIAAQTGVFSKDSEKMSETEIKTALARIKKFYLNNDFQEESYGVMFKSCGIVYEW
ncbi:hypothetical protein L1267_15895 [Pseudoalteromonas sp. OFAV1]|uniref:hypothetical protein n=1 Tax=Pseudoalteromonas sp. OFAV1 TaxID=2908892 RepID=UPI001F3C650E|nr:hypothetical protein [Pseudoalteromonas sp. OFAV1]MCF2901859.1 hypothetical protein [Pseudoalteromonas sp. OFAV1]